MRTALEGLKSWQDFRWVMTDANHGVHTDTWTFDRLVEDIQKRAERASIELKRIEEVGGCGDCCLGTFVEEDRLCPKLLQILSHFAYYLIQGFAEQDFLTSPARALPTLAAVSPHCSLPS